MNTNDNKNNEIKSEKSIIKEDAINKNKFNIESIKNNSYAMLGIGLVSGIICGNFFAPLCSDVEHDGVEVKIEYMEKENADLNGKITKLESDIKSKDTEISNLSEKVAEAKPFFDMKEEERLAIEEAERKAEEERLAKEEAERLEKEKAELEARTITLSNGNYTAGVDFDAGIYDIIAVKGGGNVSSSNMFSGGINAIMGTQDDDFYEKEYKNIKLPSGTTLKVDGVKIKLVPKY